jgi:AcrR family transcriptional regulator
LIDRRVRRRERTRRSLLDAASELIATRGLEDTRIEDVTQAADLGKGAFYNYFDSKETMVSTLLTEAVEKLDGLYLRDAGAPSSFEDRLRVVVRQHEAFFSANPAVLQLFHQVRGVLLRGAETGPLQPIVRDYLVRVAQRLGSAAGGPPSDEELDLAAVLIGAVTGYHSFRVAAGLVPHPGIVERVLFEAARVVPDPA